MHRREAARSNAIWQADYAQLGILLVREDGETSRPWLTIVIDDHSRAIAGYYLGFDSPSSIRTALAPAKGHTRWRICNIPEVQDTAKGSRPILTAMGRFHNYSFGNILEIARQKPDATRVAGLYAWNQLSRKVVKGQKGIRILAPMIGSRRKNDTEASKDSAAINKPVLVGFRAVYVFDVSQTEGTELPRFTERTTGEVGEYRERLIDFITAQGIELEFKESIAPALGRSYGGKIALLPGQAPAEEFSTLVHEVAHEMLHKAQRRTNTTKTVRETEAEAIAFVVGTTIGLDNGRASADYIHRYHCTSHSSRKALK